MEHVGLNSGVQNVQYRAHQPSALNYEQKAPNTETKKDGEKILCNTLLALAAAGLAIAGGKKVYANFHKGAAGKACKEVVQVAQNAVNKTATEATSNVGKKAKAVAEGAKKCSDPISGRKVAGLLPDAPLGKHFDEVNKAAPGIVNNLTNDEIEVITMFFQNPKDSQAYRNIAKALHPDHHMQDDKVILEQYEKLFKYLNQLHQAAVKV